MKIGDAEKALADFAEVIERYLPESCNYPDAVSSALFGRSLVYCRTNRPEEAASEVAGIAQFGERISRKTAIEIQELLASSGHYTGQIDGVIGPATGEALEAYALDGCPGNPFPWQ
jgi:hypothetical protein